jgi:hypothetical protein
MLRYEIEKKSIKKNYKIIQIAIIRMMIKSDVQIK